jgi:hypothetical protein
MVPLELVQSAIVNYLLGQVTVTAIVGTDVREDQWQGADFKYPCVRVALDMVATATCQYDFSITISAFSEEASSRQDAHLCTVLTEAVEGMRVHHHLLLPHIQAGLTVGFNSLSLFVARIIGPYRAPVRTWRGDVICKVSIYEAPI